MSSPAETALIVPVRLPLPLERLRRAGIPDARLGLPAHASLLYPFAPPDSLDEGLRERMTAIVASHEAFTYQLAGRGQWPGWLYAAVEPVTPFRTLQADLAAAFPEYPIYGGAFEFVPHVTIVEGAASAMPGAVQNQAWSSLPAWRTAAFVDLIVREGDRWTVRSRFLLGSAPLVSDA